MPAVAAIPALALVAGCACGLLAVDAPPYAVQLFLVLSVAVALDAWRRGWSFVLAGAVAAAFFAGGALLAVHAWQTAWRPSLRVAFEDLARSTRAAAQGAGRQPEDDIVATEITGVLRSDASPTAAGASLSLAVKEIAVPCPRPVDGGLILTVVGDRARASVDNWRAGRTVRATALVRRPARYLDPGVPDEERVLARRGTTLVGSVKSAALVEVVARAGPIAESAAVVRAFARRAIAAAVGRWDEQAAAIVAAIVIGDRTGLDDEVERRLQEAGTYHVIAISGGNIAILAGLTLTLFRLAGLLGPSAMLSAIGGLVAYGYLVGGGASVDRATMTAVAYFAGRAMDQRGPPFNTLAVAAGLLVAADPLSVADPAFLLTFGATAAILTVVPAVIEARTVPRWAGAAVGMFAASAASEAALLPVSAFVFERVTFAGLALNFAAIPLMAVAQVAGMALVPVALVSTPLAAPIGWVAYAGARGLVWSAALVRFVPVVTWRIAAPRWYVIAVYYAGLVGAWCLWRRRVRVGSGGSRSVRALRLASAAGVAAAAIWMLAEPWAIAANRGDGALHVTFLDVGQGDSAFVRFPRGASLVVDAGGVGGGGSFDVGDRVVAPVLREAGVGRLQSLVLTHGDGDHIGGAPAILREFRPAAVWEGIPVPPFAPLQALRTLAEDVRAGWTTVQTADQSIVDGVRVVVRHPPQPDWERRRVRNDDSVVLELLWQDVSIVLTGDIGADTERVITPLFAPSAIRIVKAPHHGSLTSSSTAFVRALAPKVVVVSVGRSNPFGHPAAAVIDRYRDVGAEVFRTDRDGAVTVDTDGHGVRVHAFTGRSRRFSADETSIVANPR